MLSDVTNINGKALLLLVMEREQRPMTTKQLFTHKLVKNRLKWNTVRVYLRRLLKEQKITQSFKRGPYDVTKTRHGVVSGLRLHNIQLQVLGDIQESGLYDRRFGDVRVYFTFGVRNGKVDGRIAKDSGLLWSEWCLCRDLFLEEAARSLGHEVSQDDVLVKSAEIGNDYLKRRLDGLTTCSTLTSVGGILERIYQKDKSTVRREVKVKDTSIRAIEALYTGGATLYNSIQATYVMTKKVDELIEQNKSHSALMLDILKIMKELLKRQK